MLPPDIDPESRSRFPLPRREDMTPAAQAIFDGLSDPNSKLLRGLKGPTGLYLHSPELAPLLRPLNAYLRNEAVLEARLRETAILAAARAANSQFEWAAHVTEAIKRGVPEATAEVIKHRRPTGGLEPKDAAIINLCREAFGKGKVSPETYAAAAKLFDRRQLIDLTVLMGYYIMIGGLLAMVDMQLDEGVSPQLPA